MNDILIIARREFLQYIRTRGFILTLLLIPGWIVAGGVFRHMVNETEPVRHFAVVDETGRFDGLIERALAGDRQRAAFDALVTWTRANADLTALARQSPEVAGLLQSDGSNPATLARFAAAGGSVALLPAIQPHLRPGAPAFASPIGHLVLVDPPAQLIAAARSHDQAALVPFFTGARPFATPNGQASLFAVTVIPERFSLDAPRIEYWSENQTDPAVRDYVRRVLLDELRRETAARAGLDAETTNRLLATGIDVQSLNPVNAASRGAITDADNLRMMFPFLAGLLLILSILSISSMLLMAVIEEKSNRVVEMILASTSPNRLMAGKLLGAGAAAVLMMAGWIFGGGGIASLLAMTSPTGVIAALVKAHALGDLPGIAVCFACGLAIHTMIFLGVGAMSRSFQEAQSYLGPLMFLLFAPIGLLLVVIKDPNGVIATLLSFSPLHAPFFLMIRLPHDPPPVGTALAFLCMILSTAVIARLMALGFARNILRTDQPPRVGMLLRRIVRTRPRAVPSAGE
jgi:ABC-2 type transport system permease protein